MAKKDNSRKTSKKSSISVTNADLLNAVNSVYSRVDETHTRIDGMNTRMDDMNKRVDGVTIRMDDVQTHLKNKICELKDEINRQFTNHLSDHTKIASEVIKAAEKKRIRRKNILKWSYRLATLIFGGGGIIGAIFWLIS